MLASEGLGVSGALTLERATTLMQGYYASEFLYISAICFSKLSILVLFYTVVAVHRMHRRLMLAFGTFVMVWSIASLLVIAFQCELPRPWDVRTLRCFNMVRMAHISSDTIVWILTSTASVLDCILHSRHVYRSFHHHALRESGCLPTDPSVAQDCGRGLFRASRSRRRSLARPPGLALSNHLTRRSRISIMATRSSSSVTCVSSRLHCMRSIHGPVLQKLGRWSAQDAIAKDAGISYG
jgi:hypothetical protein